MIDSLSLIRIPLDTKKAFSKTEKKKKKKRKEKASVLAGKDGNARLFGKILFEDWRFFRKPEGLGLDIPG